MNFLNSGIFELLLSLILIYALLSILVSIITEWWNHFRKVRGNILRDAIFKMLKDPFNQDYGDLFYNHYMIEGLKSAYNKPPHYISSDMFAEVFMDVIARQVVHSQEIKLSINKKTSEKEYALEGKAPPKNIMKRFKASVKLMNPSPFKDLLQSFIDKSGDGHDSLKPYIESWFNDYMDRVSGWYKAKQRKKLMFFGFLVAIGLNVDSLHLIKVLSLDDNLKRNLVATAENIVSEYETLSDSAKQNRSELMQLFNEKTLVLNTNQDTLSEEKIQSILTYLETKDSLRYSKIKNRISLDDSISNDLITRSDSILEIASQLNIPIGWSEKVAPLSWIKGKHTCSEVAEIKGQFSYFESRNRCWRNGNWAMYFFGIIISGVSLSFGAPFWFELLSKLVSMRRTGNIPKK